MADYSAQSALALRQIKAKGKLVTFTREDAVIDPVTQEGPGAASTYEAWVVGLPLGTAQALRLFGATAVGKRRLDLHMALSGVSESPARGDRFSWSGRSYALLDDAELLDPGGTGAFYAHAYAEAV